MGRASRSHSEKLSRAVHDLLDELQSRSKHCRHAPDTSWVDEVDGWEQLQILKRVLCQRPPLPELPKHLLADIDDVLGYDLSHQCLTPSSAIPPFCVISRGSFAPSPSSSQGRINISLWKGDITTLSDVSAIVNAANAQLLGCFQPQHRCIDNVIHAAAGPRLRRACHEIMSAQDGLPEPVGSAKVTPGFNLPSQYVLHTVGPQLDRGHKPSAEDEGGLAQCYISCLEAAEKLPSLDDGRKIVAFCCISTGLFAFPGSLAARIAVETVVRWCQTHPDTSVTDIIFDVFLAQDLDDYQQELGRIDVEGVIRCQNLGLEGPLAIQSGENIATAAGWISEADYLIISAGAGLSAATGLDYTSTELFERYFPAFTKLGLHRLYDVFGFQDWGSALVKWGYYFNHLAMVRSWSSSPLYSALFELTTTRFNSRFFVRTSNADGFFIANGFPAERVSTPQGQYKFLQCPAKCRPDAVFPSKPYVDAALPHIDSVTQALQDVTKIPTCDFCGEELTLCVRGGDYFNESPFAAQEKQWKNFLREIRSEPGRKETVVLELGVGLNTPGVLRWPNEELVNRNGGAVKLIRAGIGAAGCAPWELEEQGLAVGISGDLGAIIKSII